MTKQVEAARSPNGGLGWLGLAAKHNLAPLAYAWIAAGGDPAPVGAIPLVIAVRHKSLDCAAVCLQVSEYGMDKEEVWNVAWNQVLLKQHKHNKKY